MLMKRDCPEKKPYLSKNNVQDREKVFQLVMWFINNDETVKGYINRTAQLFFDQGYRPMNVSGKNPEQLDENISSLETWLAYQVYIDLNKLKNVKKSEFEIFLDNLDEKSAQALLASGEIAIEFDIQPKDYYLAEKIINEAGDKNKKNTFIINYLTDSVLSSELIILANLYYDFFGELYFVKT